MVLDNIEAPFDQSLNNLVTPRLPVQDVTQYGNETVILGPIPTKGSYLGLGTGTGGAETPQYFEWRGWSIV